MCTTNNETIKVTPFGDSGLKFSAALAVIHVEAGAPDVVKPLSMIGIGGVNHSFERAYHRLLPVVNTTIIQVCGEIINSAMKKEIIETFREK